MSPCNLILYQGDDFSATVTVVNPDGSPADLTGYSAQSQVRFSTQDNSTPAAQFACSIAGNVITILLTHDQTRLLSRYVYAWDLQVIDASGVITTLLAGQLGVTQEVTKLYQAGTL
jgi:hypothetical protein